MAVDFDDLAIAAGILHGKTILHPNTRWLRRPLNECPSGADAPGLSRNLVRAGATVGRKSRLWSPGIGRHHACSPPVNALPT